MISIFLFLLISSLLATPISLPINTPYVDSLYASSRDFIVNTTHLTGYTEFILTSYSGMPSMFLSLTEQPDYGNTDTYSDFTTNSGVLSVVLNNNANVYLTVYAPFAGSNYTVTVNNINIDGGIMLKNGYPQYEIVQSSLKYFSFSVPSGRANVQFVITAYSGYPSIYISGHDTTPNPYISTSFDWSSIPDSSTASINILSTSTIWPSGNRFLIAVNGYDNIESGFIITASYSTSTDQNNIVLTDGLPYVDTLNKRDSDYFTYYVGQAGCDLTVSVTAFSGDPDLYVSTTVKTPDYAHCTTPGICRNAAGLGYDSLQYLNAYMGNYYIGVYGFLNNTYFSLISSLSCPNSNSTAKIVILDGVPQAGIVDAQKWSYYTFKTFDAFDDATLSLTRRYGDPDIYITGDGTTPSFSHHQWASTSSGNDFITLKHTDTGFCAYNCTFFVGVYGFSASQYTIAMTSGAGTLKLIDGVAFHEDLKSGTYEYFEFLVTDAESALTVSVTSLGRGDPDIYISTSNTHPIRTNYTWSSSNYLADSITISPDNANFVLGHYYIGVFAYSDCTFTIIASSQHDIQLQNGVPQSATVLRSAIKYFDFSIVPAHDDLTFDLSVATGYASLYVSTTGRPDPNDPATYSYKAPWYLSVKQAVLPHLDSLNWNNKNADGSVIIYAAVYGDNASNFTVTAFTSESNIVLQSGKAFYRQVDTNSYEYFSITVDSPNMNLAIIVTPITGDPDLYVSSTIMHPLANNSDSSSTKYGADIISFKNATVSTYYISVFAFINSTFTIAAFIQDPTASPLSNIIWINNGVPQVGFQTSFNFQYYLYFMDSIASKLNFACNQISGDPDIYVALNKLPITTSGQDVSDWRSFHIGSDTISVADAQPGLYYIAVKSFLADAAWSLTVSMAGSISILRDGIPLQGSVAAKQYSYYYLPVDRYNQDITITVTPLSGDPDLYVSTQYTHPNFTNAQWKALQTNGDSVTISTTDKNFCGNCKYFIAIYAFTSSVFTVTASYRDTIELEDGTPQTGFVAKEAFAYFMFSVYDIHQDITVSVTPIIGNPNIYISASTQKPTLAPSTYSWHSANWYSGENIVISYSDPYACKINESEWLSACNYYIGVYGQTDSNFTIVATTSHAVVKLQDSISVRDWVDSNTYEYFSYQLGQTPNSGDIVTFIVTSLSGDPDIYVSTTEVRPNATTPNTYAGTSFGSDVITVSNPTSTIYYISVTSISTSTFTVLAQFRPNDDTSVITSLVNGVPQTGIVKLGHYNYFSLRINTLSSDFTISLNRKWGTPNIYVSNSQLLPTAENTIPSWSAIGGDLLTISPCVPGTYYIGVYGAGFYSSVFTLFAATSDSIITLSNGVSFGEDLRSGVYERFQFYVDSLDNDLTITVTSFGGDPDLYVSTIPYPNNTFYQYAGRSIAADSITIPSTSLKVGVYYISVLGFSNTTFSIVASFSSSIGLQDGVAQGGSVNYEAVNYYTYDLLTSDPTTLTFSLTPLNGGNVFLYISNITKPIPSNINTFQFSSTKWRTQQQVVIYPTNAKYCSGCRYYVAVYGVSVGTAATYSLTTSTAYAPLTLQDGIPVPGVVASGSYKYFSYSVQDINTFLFISVSTITGDPDLYVSTINNKPNTTNFQWRSSYSGSDTVVVKPTDVNFKTGTYYIAVFAYSDSTFSISASSYTPDSNTTSNSILINGQAQTSVVLALQARIYSFSVGGTALDRPKDFTITVTPLYGDPDIYLRDDNSPITISNYQWKANLLGRDSITVSPSCYNCTYQILIYGFIESLFKIVASTSDSIVYLDSGIPLTDLVQPQSYNYFAIVVPTSLSELYISVQAVGSGDPDLFVSTITSNPTISNHTWAQVRYGDDRISILNPLPATYYIGIYGYVSTTFVLTATLLMDGVPQQVLNGVPVSGYVHRGSSRQYVYFLQDSHNTKNEELVITVTPEVATGGYTYVYVSKVPNPSSTNYNWTSAVTSAGSSRNLITIAPLDGNACFNCTYYIGVYGYYADSAFTLFATTGAVLLVSGQPFVGSITLTGSRYFMIYVDDLNKDVTISLTTFNGQANLFVSLVDDTPSSLSYNWTMAEGSHQLVISHADPAFPKTVGAVMYIAVDSLESATFSILVSTDLITLVDGYQQVVTLSSIPTYLSLSVGNLSNADLSFIIESPNAQALSGHFDVYVSTNFTNNHPGPNQHDLAYTVNAGTAINILHADNGFCSNCVYYFSVIADGTMGPVSAFITGSTSDGVEVLLDTKAGSVIQFSYRYYELFISDNGYKTVLLESCSGSTFLYGSEQSFRPDKNNFAFKSDVMDALNPVTISPSMHFELQSIYLGVYGQYAASSSAYRVTIYNGSTYSFITFPNSNSNKLSALYAEDGTMAVTWDLAASTTNNSLTYNVYYAIDSPDLVMYSKCGLETGAKISNNVQVVYPSKSAMSQAINGLVPGTSYLFNVLVTDSAGNWAVYLHTTAYVIPSTPTPGTTTDSSNTTLILGFGIPIFIIMIIAISYLFYRNRKLSQELDIEMQDVPKAAIIKAVRGTVGNGVESGRTEKYSALLDDGVHEDDDSYMGHGDYTSAVDVSYESIDPPLMSDDDHLPLRQ